MSAAAHYLVNGWSVETIEALAEPKGIAYGVLKPGPQIDDGVPMLRVSDIRDGRVDQSSIYRISQDLDREYRRTKLRGGEVVVSIQGSVGRVAVVPAELAGANVSRTLAMIRLRETSLNRWIQKALESPQVQQAMREVIGGTTRDSLNLRDLRQIEVPVPPEPQRSGLLGLLEAVAHLTRSSNEHVRAARRAVERFRQSVLAAACSGRLTADWRLSHKESNAGVALEGFLAQRKYRPRGRKSQPIEQEGLPALPDTWVWTDLDSVARDQPNALKAGPFGSSITKAMYASSGFKVYGQEQVIRGDAAFDTYFISEEKFRELESCAIQPADILVSLVGTIGSVLVLPEGCQPGIINPRLIKLSLNRELIGSEFARLVLSAPLTNAYYQRASQGSTMEILNLAILRGVSIPLPPYSEQEEIVRRVERLMLTAAELDAHIANASRAVSRSSQAVLAKAFRGELGGIAAEGE